MRSTGAGAGTWCFIAGTNPGSAASNTGAGPVTNTSDFSGFGWSVDRVPDFWIDDGLVATTSDSRLFGVLVATCSGESESEKPSHSSSE